MKIPKITTIIDSGTRMCIDCGRPLPENSNEDELFCTNCYLNREDANTLIDYLEEQREDSKDN